MKPSSTGIREHIKNVELRFGSINLFGSTESAIFLPITLPLGLNFVERIGPNLPRRLLLLLHLFSHSATATNTTTALTGTITHSETKRLSALTGGDGGDGSDEAPSRRPRLGGGEYKFPAME